VIGTFFTSTVNLLFRPNTFFFRISDKKESLLLPAVIVVLGSITAFLIQVYYLITTRYPTSDTLFADILLRMSLVFPYDVLGSVVIWAIASASIFAVSKKFSGTGSLKRTFQVIGYGLLPIAACSSLRQVFGAIAMITMKQAGDTSYVTYAGNPFGHLSMVLSSNEAFLVIVLWTGYICIPGIMNGHRIAAWKATIAVVAGQVAVIVATELIKVMMGV
jgi:hypothetical protein